MSYKILDRGTKIHSSALLEASAGTGKTFAIEHLVTRLLIEPHPKRNEPLSLSDILALTFTRKATRELRSRIRENIHRSAIWLSDPNGEYHDYLHQVIESGPQAIQDAVRRLRQALQQFDEAQIYTIHGFCAAMLRQHRRINLRNSSEIPLTAEIVDTILNGLRTELSPKQCSPAQLNRLLSSYPIEDLNKALYRLVSKDIEIAPQKDFDDYLNQFIDRMQYMKRTFSWSSAAIIKDFECQLPFFKKLDGQSLNELIPAVERFAGLFDRESWNETDLNQLVEDDLILAKLEYDSRKKKNFHAALTYPDLASHLREHLLPIVSAARNPHRLLAWLARRCQKILTRRLSDTDSAGPDQLLTRMREALKDPSVCKAIQSRYLFAIVDEFQDTDPLQWEILKRLFIGEADRLTDLVLVGDPKQAIYRFRNADIYTYLSAMEHFEEPQRYSLSVNYRSTRALVDAINALFSPEHSAGLFHLPALEASLPFQPSSAADSETGPAVDDRGPVHFILAEGDRGRSRIWPTEDIMQRRFLPYIVHEISRLTSKEGYNAGDIAILIRDRYQGQEVLQFLDAHRIPAAQEGHLSLLESSALPSLIEWLECMRDPQNIACRKRALAGHIIGWSAQRIVECSDDSGVLSQLLDLRDVLDVRGVAAHLEALMASNLYPNDEAVLTSLVRRKGGHQLYHDLYQLVNLFLEERGPNQTSIDQLLQYYASLLAWPIGDDARFRASAPAPEGAVKIVTMHKSKGLEYPIVFALGLSKRYYANELFIPSSKLGGQIILAEDDPQELSAYYHEIDAEKIRLAYVAMTRAKKRLYLPMAFSSEPWKEAPGQASCIELVLAHLGKPNATIDENQKHASPLESAALCNWLDRHRSSLGITYDWVKEKIEGNISRSIEESVPLVAPKAVSIPGVDRTFHSFTSLTSSLDGVETHAQLTEDGLPCGVEAGLVFHHIFETLPFDIVKSMISSEELIDHMRPMVEGSAIQGWEYKAAELVFNTLKTALPLSSPTALCDINTLQHIREVPFLYPTESGLMRGSIDLLFEHQGRYYIVDWKTNRLEGYSQGHLERAMQQHQYQLQEKIYREAARRYLQLYDARPFEELYGGTFYLFIRGIQPGSTEGIYTIYEETT